MSLQNFKPLFPVILWIFDLECHSQVSLKVTFVEFGLTFMKFRKLKGLHLEPKNPITIKLGIFTAQVILCSMGQKVFLTC